jgi:hypothetical protein
MKKIEYLVFLALVTISCNFKTIKPTELTNDTKNKYFVSEVLKDECIEFDPWNKIRWAEWYNNNGQLIRQFDIDKSVRFALRKEEWTPEFCTDFKSRALFVVAEQGVHLDGNGVIFDVCTAQQKLPLDDLFEKRKSPWDEGCELIAVLYDLPEKKDIKPTTITGFTFKGWKRGIKINGTGKQAQHRLIVDNCIFTRNRIGFYTNGYNTRLTNSNLFENGYGAIYSGSKSRRNQFINNVFRDNCLSQHQYSYADFIGDTFFDSEIKNNRFVKSQIDKDFRRIGISLFRNMGESNRLRQQMPHNNIIRSNYFDGYSVAINIGARMGRNTRNDITGEGRDYAFYNHIDSNLIKNSTIGIKVNTEGNTITNNSFNNVENDIVLHCVFFELKNTTINHQKNEKVKLWYTIKDYKKYADWFGFQDDLNGSIQKTSKRIEVFSVVDGPDFPESNSNIFKLNPVEPKNMENILFDHRLGLPASVVSGEFSLDLPGKEMVAIWNKPISRIKDTDYYSILIFDEKGTEINRCGRSEIKWKQIAAGYFIRIEGEMEIAAIPANPINGKYPVYIFDRGFRIPKEIRFSDNTNPQIAISVNKENELIVAFD